MTQTKRKTNVVILAVVMSLVFAFALAAALFTTVPETDTAYAASTRVMESITIANMYANRTTGTYGNFSWDPSKLKEITSSSFTIKASVAAGYQPFYICWTRPTGTAYPSKLNYGYTIGADVNGDSAGKTWESSFPSDVSVTGKTYPVGEISLSGNYDTIYFCMGHNYSYADLVVTSITFQPKINTVKVTATAGAGVQSVYLSKNQNATSGSASGTNFDKGDTVYAFATLAEGYKHQNNNWTLVSGTADTAGAIYRVSSSTMGTSDYSFGTINAAAKTKSLTRNTNGAGYMSNLTLTYGQTANLTVPTRNGYNFLGWNTNAEGTGTTYGNASAAELTASQVNAIIDDSSINTVYAMWRIGKDTVIGFINDIPDPVVYTQACKDAIDTARGGYNDLSAEDKALVTNYDKLTEAEGIYAGMQSDKEALDAYKITKKADADDLAQVGDSAACGTLISGAKDNIDAVVYDCTKTLDQNKAVVDAILADLADALELQRKKDAFEAYKAPKKADADDLAEVGDSAACATLITNAKAAIDALAYDEDKTLDENKAAVDAIVDELSDALELQRKKDAFDTYKAEKNGEADGLAEIEDSAACETLITNAKAAINALVYDEDKTLDENKAIVDAIVNELTNALTAQRNNEAAAAAVSALIDAIPDPVVYTNDCKEKIDAANEAYGDLTPAQLAILPQEEKDALEVANAAYKALDDQAKADAVIALINGIGTVEYTTECKGKIDAAKQAYDELTLEQKALVENQSSLPTAETTYNSLGDQQKAQQVKQLISSIGEVTYPDSKNAIDAARSGYDGLTEAQKPLVDNYDVLTTAETTYAELEAKANKKLSAGAIAGIVIGCIVFACLVAFLFLFFFKKKKDKNGAQPAPTHETSDQE